jgi:expansin (peptidoglycan-binding protein)|uniref:Expansin-like EG45 domain-containing protein n=1 Tax=Globisporangium ultimum (strain ATCC 200006 / CBS 805.95 / DAOM BR144) TaxID=431595 RepID=K3X621_GLOUD
MVTLFVTTNVLSVHAKEVFEGRATTYGLTKAIGGGCSARKAPNGVNETLFAAMNRQQYADSASCSRCISVKGAKGTVLAYVADYCYECGENNLDLNTALWDAVIGGDPRIEPISWYFTPCPDEKEKFCVKEGSNAHWFALQVVNSRDGIKSMEIEGQDAAVIGITSFYQVSPSAPLDLGRIDVKITSTSGITSKLTLASKDYNDCPMPSDNSNSNTNAPATVTSTPIITVDTTGVKPHQYAWQAYRRRRAKYY